MTHKLLIVDDHPIVRRGLRQLVANQPDLEVCGEASGVEEAFEQVVTRSPMSSSLTSHWRAGMAWS